MFDCISPTLVRGSEYRCGQCFQCRRYEAEGIVNAAKAEAIRAEKTWFVTLTYRNVERPCPEEGRKDVRRLMDTMRARLRRKDGVQPDIRFGQFPEHGTRRGNFHYHLLVFGPEALTYRMFNIWHEKKGFFKANLVFHQGKEQMIKGGDGQSNKAFEYCAKYVAKEKGVRRSFSKNFGVLVFDEVAQSDLYAEASRLFPAAKLLTVRPHGADEGWPEYKKLTHEQIERMSLDEIAALNADVPERPRSEKREGMAAYAERRLLKKSKVIDASTRFGPRSDDVSEALAEDRPPTVRWGLPVGNDLEKSVRHQADWWREKILAASLTGKEYKPGVPEVRALTAERIEALIGEAPTYCQEELWRLFDTGAFQLTALMRFAYQGKTGARSRRKPKEVEPLGDGLTEAQRENLVKSGFRWDAKLSVWRVARGNVVPLSRRAQNKIRR